MENDLLLSVILPVYNGEVHLNECINSVLNQTFSDFEFIIVDDASTDRTPQILKEYQLKDKRIRVITHKINQKQTAAANTAIKNANGIYLARMDADDVALPNRFIKQLKHLKNNPEIGLLGSWVDIINDGGEVIKVWETIASNGYLGWNLFFGTSFAHSSVMMRKDIVEQVGYYQAPEAEDYDLWSRINRVSKVENIPEVLQHKRVWSGQLALKVPTETRESVIQIMQNNINFLLDNKIIDLNTVRQIRSVSDKNSIMKNSDQYSNIFKILNDLYSNYLNKNNLTKLEKKLVSKDLFQKLNTLTNWMKSINSFQGLLWKLNIFFRFPKYSIYKLITQKQ